MVIIKRQGEGIIKETHFEIEYLLYDLSVKIYSTIILPTRYDKK